MSKVLTFSRKYPSKHPKAGEQTYFIEKMWACFADIFEAFKIRDHCIDWDWHEYYNAVPKRTTIRAGRRWKAGEFFCPRYWSGKPYVSKQVTFGPDIKLENVLDVEITIVANSMIVGYRPKDNPEQLLMIPLSRLAINDGLDCQDFIDWFKCHPKKKAGPMLAQILIWDKNLKYD